MIWTSRVNVRPCNDSKAGKRGANITRRSPDVLLFHYVKVAAAGINKIAAAIVSKSPAILAMWLAPGIFLKASLADALSARLLISQQAHQLRSMLIPCACFQSAPDTCGSLASQSSAPLTIFHISADIS